MVPVADKTKGEKGLVWRRGTVVHIDFSGVVGDPGTAQEMANVVRERGGGLRFVGLRAEDVFDPRLRARIEGLGKQGSEVVSSAVALQSAGAEAPALSMDTRDPGMKLRSSEPLTDPLQPLPCPSRHLQKPPPYPPYSPCYAAYLHHPVPLSSRIYSTPSSQSPLNPFPTSPTSFLARLPPAKLSA